MLRSWLWFVVNVVDVDHVDEQDVVSTGVSCILSSCDQDVLLVVVLDVNDLDVGVVVVTACARCLLVVLLLDVCSRCTTSCCPSSSAC